MKYMGSKAKIAEEIIPIMVKDRKEGQCFVDLFCGGCNLLDKVDGKRIGNDINQYLIAMWQSICTFHQKFPLKIEKEFYDVWRDYYNKNKKSNIKLSKDNLNDFGLCGWVGFMGSFNGRFYDGGYSGHNVIGKTGKSRDYIKEQIANTLQQVPKLLDVEFVSKSYDEIILPDNSIIYCDIPYKNTKQYSTSKNFDYDKFYEWCRSIVKQGHKLYISEYWMPEDFTCIWQKEVTNAMNPTITKKPIEKLFTIFNN